MAEECPDENALLDLVSGERPSRAVAEHVANCPTCSLVLADAFGAAETPDLAPGTTLGRYRIANEIGRGGAGIVYEAHDELLDRAVAIKLLRRSSPEARTRLLREARLIAKLDHANVVSIYDAGESSHDPPTLYFAMEIVHGHSVRELMTAGGNRRDLLRAMCDAGRGLAAAHRSGITHRDFKPANVLISDAGRAVVVDFGLAATELAPLAPSDRADDSAIDDRLTMTGQVFGTPAYMPPEQISGGAIDARSDQFAFCASLFHVLTGALPFRGATLADLRTSIDRGELDARALATLPRRVARVVTRGLSADPARRFPSMDALLSQLDGRSRLVIGGAVIAVAVVVGGAAMGGYLAHEADAPAPSDPCRVIGARGAQQWTAIEQRAVAATLSRQLSQTQSQSITTTLSAWVDRWSAARETACRAAQPGVDARRDREALCLDGLLVELGATIDVLSSPDAEGARLASYAITALPSLALCQGAKPPISSEARTARVDQLRRRLAMLAAIDRRGGVAVTVLAGSPEAGNRLYALSLPDARVAAIATVPYPGDLWELRPSGAHEALAFDRKRDVLVTLDRRTATVVRTVSVAGDIQHNGRGLAVSPSGEVIALFQGRQLHRLDPLTGHTTPLSTLDAKYQLETMTYCPDGTLYAAASEGAGNPTGRTLVTLVAATGAATPIGAIGPDAIDIDTLTCDRDGTLYGLDTINLETNDLYAIDPRTGARTLIAAIPGPVSGLLVDEASQPGLTGR